MYLIIHLFMARPKDDDKVQALLGAALRRFLHYGLRKTTVQEIASDAGVAVGTVYRYFKDKDALVVGCAERFALEHRQQAQALLAKNLPADQKLLRYVLHRYAVWQDVGVRAPHADELAQAILRLAPQKPVEGVADFQDHLALILDEGNKSGDLPSALGSRDAPVLAIALAIFFPLAGCERPQQPSERELKLVLAWFLNVFRQPPRTPHEPSFGTHKKRRNKLSD